MLELASLAVKISLYVGALGAAGLGLHAVLLGQAHRHLIVALAGLLTVAVLIRLFLLNAELAGGLTRAFDFSMFTWIWMANQNQVFAYVAGAAALSVGAMVRSRAILALGAFMVFAGAGLAGHTHSLEPPTIFPFLVSVHVAVAAFWITAPYVLWPSEGISDSELVERMKTFSKAAMWCVPILFIAGLWLTWRLSGSLSAVLDETYGRLLIIKFLLATAALALGAYNKLNVTSRLETHPEMGRALLKQTLRVDYFIFAVVLATIAAATTLTGPGG